MKKALLIILCTAVFATAYPQETGTARRKSRGEAAGYSSRDATVLSMMGWGVALAVGFAAICALIPNDTGSTSFH